MVRIAFSVALVLGVLLSARSAGAITARIFDVHKIADDAPHSAFTDLIEWKGTLVCAFRQGRSHISTDGRIAVLTSDDGDDWTKSAELTLDAFDLRDASLSQTPDGRLMLLGGAAPRVSDGKSAPTGTFVAFSEDTKTWTTPEIVIPPGRWLWRITWQKGRAYGVSYAAPENKPVASLLVSDDGRKFEALVPRLFDHGYPTEAVVRFAADGTAYCLQRRDGQPPNETAFLGSSRSPYDQWTWQNLGAFIGGPNLIATADGQWIAAGRAHHESGPKTELFDLDVETGTLQSIAVLPSGGDSSYPGLVWRDGLLWVSYYSSHEGKACIYLARVQVKP